MSWDLLNRARTEQGALDQLFREHADRVHRVAWGVLQNASAAEDVVQDVFVRLARNRRLHFRKAKFTTWLHTVTVNAARQHLRKHRRELAMAPVDLPRQDSQSAGAAESQVSLSEVATQLAALSQRQREVFVLRMLEGYSTKETAHICRCGQASVKTHLHRAMNLLKENLKHE